MPPALLKQANPCFIPNFLSQIPVQRALPASHQFSVPAATDSCSNCSQRTKDGGLTPARANTREHPRAVAKGWKHCKWIRLEWTWSKFLKS